MNLVIIPAILLLFILVVVLANEIDKNRKEIEKLKEEVKKPHMYPAKVTVWCNECEKWRK